MSAPYVELDQPLEESALLCRGCLADSGEMKDMAEWGLTDVFYKFTDVQVDLSEGLSQLLCTQCEDILVKCKDFRSQCLRSDSLLRDIAKKKIEDNPETLSTEVVQIELEVEGHSIPKTSISNVLDKNCLIINITAAGPESKIYLPCPYDECPYRSVKKKDLAVHLIKAHNAIESFAIDLRYFCYHKDCRYHFDSQKKWFSGRKFLNQHYNKVHKNKTFSCEVCSMKFSTEALYNGHLKNCNVKFSCSLCDVSYNTNEKLLVHLLRRHPDLHKQYKDDRKATKRKAKIKTETKKVKNEERLDYICDSPKRSFATQTLKPEENIKNDVTLTPWDSNPSKSDYKTDEISTQTVFEDLLSLKSQNSEDESIFFSETVSLSDIQTQTFPIEFGLSRSNKETITSETQSPDLSIKETQTCFCLYDSPKVNYRHFDSVSSSPASISLTSTQTQTSGEKSEDHQSFITTETQTCFEDEHSKDDL